MVLVNVLLTFGGTQKLSCFRAVSGIASGGGGGGLLFQRWHTQKHREIDRTALAWCGTFLS